MKQIFDDMRKEIDIHSDEACFMPDDMMVIPESQMKQMLDEAEAKWEAEVCEWKELTWDMYKAHERIVKGSVLKEWNFCPYCGKPIKIAEVE